MLIFFIEHCDRFICLAKIGENFLDRPMENKQIISHRNPFIWAKDAWQLAAPYWKSKNKYKSLALIGLVVACNLLVIYFAVLFNKWYNVFYNAIQTYDKVGFINAIYRFCFLAFFYIAFQIFAYYFRKILEIRWREWLTHYYLSRWFDKKAYYKMQFIKNITDNPDQRISEDVNNFIVLFLNITLGLMNSLVTLASFMVILWEISGVFAFEIASHKFAIPGYMVWIALVYAILGTYFTFKIGKPIIKLEYQKQAYEADFRFGLMGIREHSENIAFYDGEEKESSRLVSKFSNVVKNFIGLIHRQIKIDLFGIGYAQLAVIFPIVVAAPRYFAKQIQLGALMQILSAFGQVQDSLSYFVTSYTSLSTFRAIMDRLHGFDVAVEESLDLTRIPVQPGEKYLEIKNLSINLPTGKMLMTEISALLNSGDRLLIRGRSGSGKTTLLRTIAGLWHFATGEIYQKSNLSSLFIAQKPYLPIGTLKEAICYPKMHSLPHDDVVISLLKQCGLGNLVYGLHLTANWSSKLSIGEQQRVAFCRVFVNEPDVVYLDEATSALDEETEELMYQILQENLPRSAIISIGHRSTIRKWHNQEFNFGQA